MEQDRFVEMNLGALFLGGVLAGWGVAVPLGAVGLLVVREALAGGFRAGSAAGAGVAVVDGLYCVAAVAFGAVAAPLVTSWGAVPGVLAGVVLMALGGFGLVRRDTGEVRDRQTGRHPSSGRIFITFVGLTVVNPATLLYFGALTAALPHSLGLDRAPLLFVMGVVGASLAWQLGLALVGACWGGRIGPRGQAILSVCGYGLVVGLGAAAVVVALVSVV